MTDPTSGRVCSHVWPHPVDDAGLRPVCAGLLGHTGKHRDATGVWSWTNRDAVSAPGRVQPAENSEHTTENERSS